MINKRMILSLMLVVLVFFAACDVTQLNRIEVRYQGDDYYVNKGLEKVAFDNFSIWLPEKLVKERAILEENNESHFIISLGVLNEIKDYPNPKYLLYVEESNFLPENYVQFMSRGANGQRNVVDSTYNFGNRVVFLSDSFWASSIVLNDGGLRIYSVVSENYGTIIQIEVAHSFSNKIETIISSIQLVNNNQKEIDFDSNVTFKLDSANYRNK